MKAAAVGSKHCFLGESCLCGMVLQQSHRRSHSWRQANSARCAEVFGGLLWALPWVARQAFLDSWRILWRGKSLLDATVILALQACKVPWLQESCLWDTWPQSQKARMSDHDIITCKEVNWANPLSFLRQAFNENCSLLSSLGIYEVEYSTAWPRPCRIANHLHVLQHYVPNLSLEVLRHNKESPKEQQVNLHGFLVGKFPFSSSYFQTEELEIFLHYGLYKCLWLAFTRW